MDLYHVWQGQYGLRQNPKNNQYLKYLPMLDLLVARFPVDDHNIQAMRVGDPLPVKVVVVGHLQSTHTLQSHALVCLFHGQEQ